jgi:hypothetical protein
MMILIIITNTNLQNQKIYCKCFIKDKITDILTMTLFLGKNITKGILLQNH